MRYLAFALIAAMISVFGLGAWEGIKAIAAEGDEEVTAPASFISAEDTVVTDFIFYTTDNASKKVPAANKWIKTNAGAVDVSNLTKGKTLYFANSTTPSLDEIVAVVVPASPVLSAAKYDAKGEDIEKKFVFQTKVKVGKKTVAVDVPKARIEIKVNDNSAWKPFDKAITDGTLQALQKEGATVYARIAPTNTEIAYDEDTRTCTFVDAGISEDEDTSIENGEDITRYGVAKTFKIAKKAAGPAVKVDYANHSITLKKGQSYIKTDDKYVINEDEWKNVTDSKGEKVYFNSVTDAEYYGVKTSTSLTTYLLIPSSVSFADTNSAVTIQGGNGEAATLAVTANVEDAVAKATKVAYQYAIVDLNGAHKDLIKDGVFDYEKSLSFTAKADKITWKNVSVTIKKDEATGTATASIPWKSVAGKQVLVRKAAAGTEFSSQVVVFNAPTGDGFATYAPEAAMPEVNCWTMLTQANYGSGFAGNNTNMRFCANISNAAYDAEAKTIKFDIVAGAEISETAKVALKVGKTEYVLDDALVVEDKDIKTDMGATNATTKNKSVTIDLSKVKDFPASNAVKATIIVPAGYASNEDGVATAAKTINITIDNQAPKATKVAFKDGTVTITVDDAKLAMAANAKIEAKDASDNDVIVFTDVKFDGKKKTITAKYEVKVTSEEKVTLTLDGITDAAGNKIDAGDVLKDVANPGYVKQPEEPTSPEGNE